LITGAWCRNGGRNPVFESWHLRCWRSKKCRRISSETAVKATAMSTASGEAGARTDDVSRRQKKHKKDFMIAIAVRCRPPPI
jgi:hypothetical protein